MPTVPARELTRSRYVTSARLACKQTELQTRSTEQRLLVVRIIGVGGGARKFWFCWKSGQNPWKSGQNPWKSLKIWTKWRPTLFEFKKWCPTFAEWHMKSPFFEGHTEKILMIFVGENLWAKSRAKTFRASLGKFGQKFFAPKNLLAPARMVRIRRATYINPRQGQGLAKCGQVWSHQTTACEISFFRTNEINWPHIKFSSHKKFRRRPGIVLFLFDLNECIVTIKHGSRPAVVSSPGPLWKKFVDGRAQLVMTRAFDRDEAVNVEGGPCPHKFLEYLVILCFERQYFHTKHCCSPKINISAPQKNLGWQCHCMRQKCLSDE